MAGLTNLESKLGEVIVLATAAQGATPSNSSRWPRPGEAGHWEILKTLNERASNSGVQELVDWGIPIQQLHFETMRQGSLKLASEEHPNKTS